MSAARNRNETGAAGARKGNIDSMIPKAIYHPVTSHVVPKENAFQDQCRHVKSFICQDCFSTLYAIRAQNRFRCHCGAPVIRGGIQVKCVGVT